MQLGLVALAGVFGVLVLFVVWEAVTVLRAAAKQTDVLLLHRVLDRCGIRRLPDDAADRLRLGHAARRCMTCKREAQCRAWLEGDARCALDEFCPNASLVSTLCGRSHGRTA